MKKPEIPESCLPTNRVSNGVCRADGSRSARARVARVRLLDATLVFTDESCSAIGIPDALRSASGNGVRFRDQARLTSKKQKINQPCLRWVRVNISGYLPANWVSNRVHWAHRSRSAWARVARIRTLDAPLVLANKTGSAVRIPDTFRTTSGNCVRLGNQALVASGMKKWEAGNNLLEFGLNRRLNVESAGFDSLPPLFARAFAFWRGEAVCWGISDDFSNFNTELKYGSSHFSKRICAGLSFYFFTRQFPVYASTIKASPSPSDPQVSSGKPKYMRCIKTLRNSTKFSPEPVKILWNTKSIIDHR